MLYPELFRQFESVRWTLESDVPWHEHDPGKLTEDQAQTVKMNAITEWAALPATEMFLRDNHGDSDFCAFMSIWFYEEQKHALVLMEYLRRYRPELVPTEDELHAVRFEFDPAPALETLMLHFCGEVRLNHWYRRASEWHTEPVIKRIYELIARDEARHGGAYLRWNDAFIPTVKLDYRPFSIALSYDVNISKLKMSSHGRGGSEISVSYVGFLDRNNSSLNAVKCPRF